MTIGLSVFLVWNVLVAVLYGLDKRRAIKHAYRIPEWVLLVATSLLGGPGAFIGMYGFHHKTRKWYFRSVLWADLVILVALVVKMRDLGLLNW